MAAEHGKWIKGCESAHCVEVFFTERDASISATEDYNIVTVNKAEWVEFVNAVKAGKFDL